MKIPQRNDQVQLGAPQTQAGRAVQPDEGSLGDSYLTAMRGMSKQLDELSELQFKLSENAVKGQLNAFNIYVDSRTKQYNEDLKLATNKQQIDELYAGYLKDITETGNATLGDNLYQNWERVKGGTTIAGAEYTGELANTQLMIKENQQLLKTSLDVLNVEAGNAATPEEEKQKRQEAYDTLNEAVENGTINAAQAENERHKFDHDLDATQIKRLMFSDPEDCIKKLLTNDFAPAVTYPERQKFMYDAIKEYRSSIGTGNSKVSKGWMDYWGKFQQLPEGSKVKAFVPKIDENNRIVRDKNGRMVFEISENADARKFASLAIQMANHNLFGDFADWVGKVMGVDPKTLHEADLEQIRDHQIKLVDFGFSADTQAFEKEYGEFKQNAQYLFNDALSKKADNAIPPINWGNTYTKMRDLDRDAGKLFAMYRNAKSLTDDTTNSIILGTGKDRMYVNSVKDGILDVFIADIDKEKLKQDNPAYKELHRVLKGIDGFLMEQGQIYGDTRQAEKRFLDYLFANNDVEQLFTNGNEMQRIKAITEAQGVMYGVAPSDMWKKESKKGELILSDTPAWQVTQSLYTTGFKTSFFDIGLPMPTFNPYTTEMTEGEEITTGDLIGAGLSALGFVPTKVGKGLKAGLESYVASRPEVRARQKEESRRNIEAEIENYKKMTGPYSTTMFVPESK